MRSEIIKPVKKVRGGISVSHEKHTKDMQVKRIPAPETVTLPMSQHIGAPCTPTVKVGDRVLVGQVVGDTDKYVSAPVHASVSKSEPLKVLCLKPSLSKTTGLWRRRSLHRQRSKLTMT